MLAEHRERRVARGVEPMQVLDPEQGELTSGARPDHLEKRPKKTCAARVRIESGMRRNVIGHPEKLEPEVEGDRVGVRVLEATSHGVPDVRRRRAFGDTEETARKRRDHVKDKGASVRERA